MNIVILHSSVTNRRIFVNVFGKMSGSRVYACGDESEFLDRLNELAPDLLVVEKKFVYLHDGHFLDAAVRPQISGKHAIMIAGYQFTKQEAVDVIRKGADELLLLPFTAESLSEKVSQSLQIRVSF